jgi:hypothetical protein
MERFRNTKRRDTTVVFYGQQVNLRHILLYKTRCKYAQHNILESKVNWGFPVMISAMTPVSGQGDGYG